MKELLKALLANKSLVAHVLGWALGACLVAAAGAVGVAPESVKAKLCGLPDEPVIVPAAEPAKQPEPAKK